MTKYRLTRRVLLACTLASLSPIPAVATDVVAPAMDPASTIQQRLDATLAGMVTSGRVVGASALVWKDGREIYFGRQGFADREAGRPMQRDTLVQLYSMTKPVTGVALMQLWEQGRFRLDDPLHWHLPEFASMRVQNGTDAAGNPVWQPVRRPISVRDLFRHTAGFGYDPGPTAAHAAFVKADPLALSNDLAEFGRRIAGVPLIAEPGSAWHYSAAVDVQALLVERLSGMPFADYVQAYVLKPLGMTQTAWRLPPENLGRFAATYVRQPDGGLAREPDAQTRALNFSGARLTMGGAGLAGPIDDYMRFARMLLDGGMLDGVRIVQPSTLALMATDQLDPAITSRDWLPGKGNLGFGLDFAVRVGPPLSAEENRGAVGEFFWDGMASTLFWVDPENRLAAVFFVQQLPFDGTLHRDIRRAVYGDGYGSPPTK